MRSVILTVAVRYLLPLLALLALFLLLRGHDAPGGGFSAGLVLAAAVTVYGLAEGLSGVRRALPVAPQDLVGLGLALALAAGLLPLVLGGEVLEGLWVPDDAPVVGGLSIGTPLVFDVGVFLAASGAVLTILVALLEDE